MNRSTPVFRANAPHPALPELQDLEREARRLRAEHLRDPLARFVIAPRPAGAANCAWHRCHPVDTGPRPNSAVR